jgi:hypothetical protein
MVMTTEFFSKLINQVTPPNAEGFGNPQKGMKADPLLAALYFANINGMQIRFFCQLLLTHFGRFAVFANGFAKDFEDLLTRHSLSANHCIAASNLKHPTWVYFLLVAPSVSA